MTLGQQAVEQAVERAVERAVEQTVQQESKKTALRMLEKALDIQLIAEVTKLSQKEIRLLAKNKGH